MQVYHKLKRLIEEKKVTIIELSEAIGMSRTGFQKMMSNETMDLTTLQKIANFFKLKESYFINTEETFSVNEPQEIYASKKYLDLLEENRQLNKRLLECMDTIEQLKKELNKYTKN